MRLLVVTVLSVLAFGLESSSALAQVPARTPAAIESSSKWGGVHLGPRVNGVLEAREVSGRYACQETPLLGIGGGTLDRFRGRLGKRREQLTGDGKALELVCAGETWLASAIELDGSTHSIALGLLALMGNGHSMTRGARKADVTAQIRTLMLRVDTATGALKDAGESDDAALDYLLCSLVLTEIQILDKSRLIRRKLEPMIQQSAKLVATPELRAGLSDLALLVGLELLATARVTGLPIEGLEPLGDEIAARAAGKDPSLLVATGHLTQLKEPAALVRAAAALGRRAVAATTTGAPSSLEDALALWQVSDALRAVGGEPWTSFREYRWARVNAVLEDPDSQFGKWEESATKDTEPGQVRATAAYFLALLADIRLQ